MAFKESLKSTAGKLARPFIGIGRFFVKRLEALEQKHSSIHVLVVAINKFRTDKMKLPSAYFSYHGFLALFPLLLLLSAILGFVLKSSPEAQARILREIYDIFPAFGDTLESILNSIIANRQLVGILGLLGTLWTGSKIATALETGMNVVQGTEKRSFIRRRSLAILILGVLAILVIVAVALNFAASEIAKWISSHVGFSWSLLSFLVSFVIGLLLDFFIFSVIYKIVPQEKYEFADVAKGAAVIAVLFHVSGYAFNFYFVNISKTKVLYGTIGVVIGILIWFYLIGIMIFLGAEIIEVLKVKREFSETDQVASGADAAEEEEVGKNDSDGMTAPEVH